jgi:acetylglutamate kinase
VDNTVGVLDKDGTLDRIDRQRDRALFVTPSTAVRGQDLPALDAIRGVKSLIIDGRVEHALLLEVLTNEGVGTMIKAG